MDSDETSERTRSPRWSFWSIRRCRVRWFKNEINRWLERSTDISWWFLDGYCIILYHSVSTCLCILICVCVCVYLQAIDHEQWGFDLQSICKTGDVSPYQLRFSKRGMNQKSRIDQLRRSFAQVDFDRNRHNLSCEPLSTWSSYWKESHTNPFAIGHMHIGWIDILHVLAYHIIFKILLCISIY